MVNNKIVFEDKNKSLDKYSYTELKEGDSSYYLYTKDGIMYQVPKDNLDIKIALFDRDNISNINVIGDLVYFAMNDTLYYYSNNDGVVPVLKNNELRYNTYNRVQVYKK